MAHPLTEKLIDDMYDTLVAHGVSEFVIAVRDPDSTSDSIRARCGDNWLAGLGMNFIGRAKTGMAESWRDEPNTIEGEEDDPPEE